MVVSLINKSFSYKSPKSVFYGVVIIGILVITGNSIRQANVVLTYPNTYDKESIVKPQELTSPENDSVVELARMVSALQGELVAAKNRYELRLKEVAMSPFVPVTPNANNTVISIISMGNMATKTFDVQRCIRSLRRRGMFTGTIMVFTDIDGYKRYQETIPSWDNQTIIVEGRDEDLHPRNQANGELIKYKRIPMIFKRFKMHHSKYFPEYLPPDMLESVRFVAYLDGDNMIGSRLDAFFQDYVRLVTVAYPKAAAFHRNATSSTGDGGFGFTAMFKDSGKFRDKGKKVMHRYVRYSSKAFQLLPVHVYFSPCAQLFLEFNLLAYCKFYFIMHSVVSSCTILPTKSYV